MRLSDRQALGDLPLQDHRPAADVDVYLRAAVFACRIEARDEFGRYVAQGHQRSNKSAGTSSERTIGDIVCAHLWRNNPDKREIPAWTFAMPARLKAPSKPSEELPGGATLTRAQKKEKKGRLASVLPLFDQGWSPDNRFAALDASVLPHAPPLPAGAVGVVIAGTNERAQESLFIPALQSLIAVNRAGDHELSSRVYDLTPANELDEEYHAPLHTMIRVCQIAESASAKAGGALAWQLGLGGQDDARGRGLVIDTGSAETIRSPFVPEPPPERRPPRTGSAPDGGTGGGRRGPTQLPWDPPATDTTNANGTGGAYGRIDESVYYSGGGGNVLAYASANLSGPFDVGSPRDVHYVGKTKEGWRINSLHIATAAYFKGPSGDGPLEFKAEPYNPNTTDGPFLTKVHLRWDLDGGLHKHLDGTRPGKWRWEAESPTYICEKDIIIPPKPPPPPPPPPKPPKDPDDPDDPDDEDEDPTEDPKTGRPLPGWGVGGWGVQVGKDPYWGSIATVGMMDESRREVLAGVVSATQTFACAVRAAGGLTLRPFATAEGQWDLSRGGTPNGHQLFGQQSAPDTAALVAIGENQTGAWLGFSDDGDEGRGKARTGPGGIAILPPEYATPDGLRGVLAGDHDASSTAHPWTETTRAARVYLPGGLASLDFCTPRAEGALSGVRMFGTGSGLAIAPLDGAGSLLASTSLEIGGEIGIKATGNLEVTGKLTVGGLIDPTGLDLVRQDASPISGSRYGIWTSDGTVAGTTAGDLYWDAAGARSALTPQNAGSMSAVASQTVTVAAARLTVDGQCWIIRATGQNGTASTQTTKLEADYGTAHVFATILTGEVPAWKVWRIEGTLYRVSSSFFVFSGSLTWDDATSAILARSSGSHDLAGEDVEFRVDTGSASGSCDALLVDKREA